jgi:hypothetical protein
MFLRNVRLLSTDYKPQARTLHVLKLHTNSSTSTRSRKVFHSSKKTAIGNAVSCMYNCTQFEFYGLCTAKNCYIRNVIHTRRR